MTAPRLVTVFGGSGFLGRHIVRELAKAGMKVRVAVRDPEAALYMKPMGDVGQVTPVQANIRNKASVEAALQGADAAINLVGILFPSGAQKFATVHKQGAAYIAQAAAKAGCTHLVHMSALGVGDNHTSVYAQTKMAGEIAAMGAFPKATILRPSVVFGPQDDFFNRFAKLATQSPFLPLMGNGQMSFQPVYVGDVASAVLKSLTEDGYQGKVYELGGPEVMTFEDIMKVVMRYTGHDRILLPLPFWMAKLQSYALSLLPNPPLTPDQVELLKNDNICKGEKPGLDAFGIRPTSAHAILPSYMDIYRKGGRYSTGVEQS